MVSAGASTTDRDREDGAQAPSSAGAGGDDELPEIWPGIDIANTVDDSIAALARAPDLFVRGGELTRVIESDGTDGDSHRAREGRAGHADTPIPKRVDFHSFRRAFATSLAEAGVNEQRAMMLTSHADSRTHRMYVQETTAMQAIPEGAVPVMPSLDAEGIVTAVSKRPKRPGGAPKNWRTGKLRVFSIESLRVLGLYGVHS